MSLAKILSIGIKSFNKGWLHRITLPDDQTNLHGRRIKHEQYFYPLSSTE